MVDRIEAICNPWHRAPVGIELPSDLVRGRIVAGPVPLFDGTIIHEYEDVAKNWFMQIENVPLDRYGMYLPDHHNFGPK
jgi:hypothetical protein